MYPGRAPGRRMAVAEETRRDEALALEKTTSEIELNSTSHLMHTLTDFKRRKAKGN